MNKHTQFNECFGRLSEAPRLGHLILSSSWNKVERYIIQTGMLSRALTGTQIFETGIPSCSSQYGDFRKLNLTLSIHSQFMALVMGG